MDGNTFQPDDLVLNEVEREPEVAELKSSLDADDGRECIRCRNALQDSLS
jgi:hypothetical protein